MTSIKDEVVFIHPIFWKETSNDLRYVLWHNSCLQSEKAYLNLLNSGASPQEARSVLPNSLKTEIIMTMNLREWRHFFNLRAEGIAGKPHPQMLEITIPLLKEFKEYIPVVFDDLIVSENK